jgi:CubicO group peptidase (beta-lactamase class C family)
MRSVDQVDTGAAIDGSGRSVMAQGFTKDGLARLDAVMTGFVERDDIPGLAWLVERHGETHVGVAGADGPGGTPVAADTIFRISSVTKPITGVAALILVEECRLRLDDPVDDLLPELADRRVLAHPHAAVDDTVAAHRPVTLRDLLTFRLGLGLDFTDFSPKPVDAALAAAGLAPGPPAPGTTPAPDEYLRRLGTVPLLYQPGERWLYHTGAAVLGVLIARAAGQPFEEFLAERLFEPLGMVDTGFSVPPDKLDRFGACFGIDVGTGERNVYDPADGQWARPPAFAGGGDGLVSTLADLRAFGEMLLGGGTYRGQRLLARNTVAAMTTNQLTPEQVMASSSSDDAATGWGFCVGIGLRRNTTSRPPGTYGWDGGLGSSWSNDPSERLTGVLLTNQTWASASPPAAFGDFWTCAYTALAD